MKLQHNNKAKQHNMGLWSFVRIEKVEKLNIQQRLPIKWL